jgi:hypothetical protein
MGHPFQGYIKALNTFKLKIDELANKTLDVGATVQKVK